MSDLRADLIASLAAFGSQPLPTAARGLFATLGYQSKRTMRIASVKQFCEHWDTDGSLTAKERTSLNRLTALHFLFQLTDAELSTQNDLFTDSGTVDGTRIHSYLFLVAELPAGTWSRTDLTAIARALNKPLQMPALVLFKHGDSLSLAVLHRRLNKVATDRDVLEKATLIKDIRCTAPHRAHVEILADLAFESLRAAHTATNFVQLHAAWRESLDIQELNKRFYRELQHWYFWALGHVRFPDGAPKDADDRDSLSLIRLLTRLIFVWFLKEKGLVPENLFDARALPRLLKGFAPADPKDKDSVYYRAVLQNLFFATLNCEPDQRGWAREGQNMMAHSLYRHRDDFAAPSRRPRSLQGHSFPQRWPLRVPRQGPRRRCQAPIHPYRRFLSARRQPANRSRFPLLRPGAGHRPQRFLRGEEVRQEGPSHSGARPLGNLP